MIPLTRFDDRALLLLMMWTVGDLCCAARAKHPSDNALAHLITGIHGRPHMPPGDNSLEERRAARARERGDMTPEQRNRRRVKVQLGGTVVSFVCSQINLCQEY